MPSLTSRALVAGLAATVLLIAGTVGGCTSDPPDGNGALAGDNTVPAQDALTALADRLVRAGDRTYTAEYITSQGRVTLVQQPPAAAFIGQAGRLIVTPDAVIFCESDKEKTRCEKAPNAGTRAGEASGLIAGATGPGFVSDYQVAGLLTEAAAASAVRVEPSTQDIGGQESACAAVSGIETADRKDMPDAFALCVTELGVLASFDGVLPGHGEVTIDLASYTTTADPAALAPPDGATVVEVPMIGPPT